MKTKLNNFCLGKTTTSASVGSTVVKKYCLATGHFPMQGPAS